MRLQKNRTDVFWSPDCDGIKHDPERVEALLELSRPNNVSALRTVLAIFQCLTKFAYDMSSVMNPMTDLLKRLMSSGRGTRHNKLRLIRRTKY